MKMKIINVNYFTADACQDANRNKVIDNDKNIDRSNGNISHQGVWKLKKKYFSKIKPTLAAGKKYLKNKSLQIQKSSKI